MGFSLKRPFYLKVYQAIFAGSSEYIIVGDNFELLYFPYIYGICLSDLVEVKLTKCNAGINMMRNKRQKAKQERYKLPV